MTPRQKAILFLLFSVILALGVTAWTLFLNRGALAISGDAPFTFSIGKYRGITCAKPPCRVKLSPKKYFLRASKKDYFDLSEETPVRRWRTQEVTLDFIFQPQIRTIGELRMPEKLASIPHFEGPKFFPYEALDLGKIPKNARAITFSKKGREAIIALGKEYYLYSHPETDDASLLKIELPAHETLSLGEKGIFVLEDALPKDTEPENAKKDRQKLWYFVFEDPENPVKTLLASFERPIQKASLFPSFSDQFIIVREKKSDGASKFYLVDAQQKIKRRLPLVESAENIRWITERHIAFEDPRPKIFSVDDDEKIKIEALNADMISSYKNGRVIFVSEYDMTETAPGVSFEELLESAGKDFQTLRRPDLEKWFFIEYDIDNDIKRVIATFEHKKEDRFIGLAENVENGMLIFAVGKTDSIEYHQLLFKAPNL